MSTRLGDDDGQATVETALVLPVVALALLLVVQVGVLLADQVLLTHAAREAARTVAVDGDASTAADVVVEASGFAPARVEVRVTGATGRALQTGDRVRVEVTYRAPIRVPPLAAVVDTVTLHAGFTARVE